MRTMHTALLLVLRVTFHDPAWDQIPLYALAQGKSGSSPGYLALTSIPLVDGGHIRGS